MNNRIKTKELILLVALFLAANFSGCAKKDQNKSDDVIEAIKEDFAQKENIPIEDVSAVELQRVGSEQMGYVSIPPNWRKFNDLDERVKDLQYSDPEATTIVTMNIVDRTGLSKEEARNFGAEDAAKNVWANLANGGASDIKGNTVKFKDYDAFQVFAAYSDGSQLAAWLFEAEDNEIHYIAIESPSKEKFMLAAQMVTSSYSLTK